MAVRIKIILTYIITMLATLLVNYTYRSLLPYSHNRLLILSWYAMNSLVYIASYIYLKIRAKSHIRIIPYFLSYIIIGIVLTGVEYIGIHHLVNQQIVVWIQLWFYYIKTVAKLFTSGLDYLFYQALIYALWIMTLGMMSSIVLEAVERS